MNHSETRSIGLVGLGQMGLQICRRLTALGPLRAYDLSPDRRALAEAEPGVTVSKALGDLASCSLIVLSLPSPSASKQVLRELTPKLSQNTIVIETSTVLPADVAELEKIAAESGAHVIDAAILSGVGQMREGQATLLVGGGDAQVDAASDVLSALGPSGIRRFGALGSGMAAKVVNNGVAHAVMVVLVEALALARSQGLSLHEVVEILGQPDGGLLRPLTYRVRDRIATGNYVGGMPLDAAQKDSALALAMAQASGVPLFATQAAHTVYEIGLASGLARNDYSAIATLWEKWARAAFEFGSEV